MNHPPFTVTGLVFSAVHVRGSSEWVFVEISDGDGYTGTAELTGPNAATQVAAALAEMADELRGTPIVDEAEVPNVLGLSVALLARDRVLATAVSGLRTAILDAQAQRAGVSLSEFLGGAQPDRVELYANINRSMHPDDDGPKDRSPELFGKMAALARDLGFAAVKCAPFDECRAPFDSTGLPDEAKPGLERVSAVREAIGNDIELLVDCHSRFDLDSALALESELHSLGVSWYEEPVNPLTQPEDLARIRAAARMPVAGGEMAYGVGLFQRLFNGGSLDVAMPDLKYCGGAGEAAAVGQEHEPRQPASVSLHSPSGPASLLASAHATAAFNGARALEHAIEEVSWRSTVLEPPERVENGALVVPPSPGLGAGLNPAVISDHGRRWTP